jgi:hypothetical protein
MLGDFVLGCAQPTSTTLSSAKAITAFSFTSPSVTGTISETAKTIAVTVPADTSVTALVATFTTTGSSVKVGLTVQASGATSNNFTNPETYTVTAADGTSQAYIVTVTGPPKTIGFSQKSVGSSWRITQTASIKAAIANQGIPPSTLETAPSRLR